MSKLQRGSARRDERRSVSQRTVTPVAALVALIIIIFPVNSCAPLNNDPEDMTYVCGTNDDLSFKVVDDHVTYGGGAICGADDPNLPPEPRMPEEVCAELQAQKRLPGDYETPSENDLDTDRIQAALNQCAGVGAVKLVTNGENAAFVSGPLIMDSVVLWVDEGVTLFQSRNPDLFQKTGNCGKLGVNDSDACHEFIQVNGTRPGIVGDGTIDGQGGEPVIGLGEVSWWELSESLRSINGSIGNPQLINLKNGTTGFWMYRIHLQNASKFHVKITSDPPEGICETNGDGFIVWGITLLTPSKVYNSLGHHMTPHFSRNSDGVDPGTTSTATCGVIACNTITTGDDQIAIKGGHLVKDLIIAHNHFGTGHGMSIGSETYGTASSPADGSIQRGVQNVHIYDLTIDADSRSVGYNATPADFNGIRIKTDISRGGLVENIVYEDICMRDMTNAILISTAYNPLFSGEYYPEYGRIRFEDVRHVSCMNTTQPVVAIEGHSDARKAGPIEFDNVVIDNIGPPAYSAEFADIEIGPGGTNFDPSGPSVTVTDNSTGTVTPKECEFPTLPAPKLPEGWLR